MDDFSLGMGSRSVGKKGEGIREGGKECPATARGKERDITLVGTR